MRIQIRQFTAGLLVISGLVLTPLSYGSAKNHPPPSGASGDQSNAQEQIFARIPADTTWVIASIEALPQEAIAAQYNTSRKLIDSYSAMLRNIVKTDKDKAQMEKFIKLLNELIAKMEPSKISQIGLRPDPQTALYGDPLLPRFHLEISDGAKFKAEIDRVFSEIQNTVATDKTKQVIEKLAWIKDGDINYLLIKLPDEIKQKTTTHSIKKLDFEMVIAIEPKLFSFGLIEAGDTEAMNKILGKTAVKKALKPDVLAQIQKDYGFKGFALGYLDFHRLYDQISQKALKSKDLDETQLSLLKKCDKLNRLLIDHVPRAVVGFNEFSGSRTESEILIETSPDVVAALREVEHPMAGYKAEDPIFAFGIAVNQYAIRNGLNSLLGFVEKNAGVCPLGSKEKIKNFRQELALALNPILAAYKSVALALEEIEFQEPPKEHPEVPPMLKQIDAYLMLNVVDPQGAVAMLGMINPDLAAIQVPTDGTLADIPLETFGWPIPPSIQLDPKIGAKGTQLGVSLGKSADKLKANLANSTTASPLIWLEMNYSKIAKLLRGTSALFQQSSPFSEKEMQAVLDIYSLIGKFTQTLEVVDKGLTLKMRSELALENN